MLVKLALPFGPAEYFALMVLALTTVTAVLGDSLVRPVQVLGWLADPQRLRRYADGLLSNEEQRLLLRAHGAAAPTRAPASTTCRCSTSCPS